MDYALGPPGYPDGLGGANGDATRSRSPSRHTCGRTRTVPSRATIRPLPSMTSTPADPACVVYPSGHSSMNIVASSGVVGSAGSTMSPVVVGPGPIDTRRPVSSAPAQGTMGSKVFKAEEGPLPEGGCPGPEVVGGGPHDARLADTAKAPQQKRSQPRPNCTSRCSRAARRSLVQTNTPSNRSTGYWCIH